MLSSHEIQSEKARFGAFGKGSQSGLQPTSTLQPQWGGTRKHILAGGKNRKGITRDGGEQKNGTKKTEKQMIGWGRGEGGGGEGGGRTSSRSASPPRVSIWYISLSFMVIRWNAFMNCVSLGGRGEGKGQSDGSRGEERKERGGQPKGVSPHEGQPGWIGPGIWNLESGQPLEGSAWMGGLPKNREEGDNTALPDLCCERFLELVNWCCGKNAADLSFEQLSLSGIVCTSD